MTPGQYRPGPGAVVVVDVLRAFTTAAVALQRGAREIWLVERLEEAFDLRRRHPEVLLMGEFGGLPVDGFDLPNSPAALADADVEGRTLVHRTSAGTRGVVQARGADLLVATSFAVAEATVGLLEARSSDPVTLLVTGDDAQRDGDEDHACAEYLAARLRGDRPDPEPYLGRVGTSTAGRLFADPAQGEYPEEDLAMARQLDRFDRALLVRPRGDLLVMRPETP